MESPSTTHGMSSPQDPRRWEPPFGLLRRGQLEFYELLYTVNKRQYGIRLPTGYGKSFAAGIAHAVLRDQGRINRTLILVPTLTQYAQYTGTKNEPGIAGDLHMLGIPYRGIEWCGDRTPTRVLNAHRRNTAEIYIATIHAIVNDAANLFTDLFDTGQWLIVADEVHHYADGNTWGQAIQRLPYAVLVGMSATPLRADKQPTVIQGSMDVEIFLKPAIDEQAIRPIVGHVSNYFVELLIGDVDTEGNEQPKPMRFSLDKLEGELEATHLNISDWEVRKKVRYNATYLSQILNEAISCLHGKNAQDPRQHQMLVFCMSCLHAEHVASVLNDATSNPQFAQWIGEGPNGKEEPLNRKILDAFQNNEFPCLVQVNKAGEGYNNKRCSVGVFLNLIGDTPMAQQQIGRFMRRNTAMPWGKDVANIFVSCDARILTLLKDYEEQTQTSMDDRRLIDDDTPMCDEIWRRLFRIPDLFVVDMEYIATTLAYPFGTLEESVKHYTPQLAPLFAVQPTDEQVRKVLLDILIEQQRPFIVSPKARKEEVQKSANRAVGDLARTALRCLYGTEFEKAKVGALCKRIHNRWGREKGYASEMDEVALREKYTWTQTINNTICRTREVPEWLSI